MYLDFSKLSPAKRYFLMTQTIVPRPVAWVLTENRAGDYNLAPFSYFNAVSGAPPLVMISVGKKPDGADKDTRVNIEERKKFVIHIAHRELAPLVTESSQTLPYGESELDRLNLKLTSFSEFALPRLKDCRVAFACELFQITEIGDTPQSMILGEIQAVYVEDSIVEDRGEGRLKIHADKLDPIGRLGGSEYSSFGEIISIPRPK